MDYYSILGVPKNASSEQLKKAYKKQSMQHHPDRGGDEAKFKEVNEAYSTLKDPQKRAAYDNPQPRFDTSQMHGGGFEDIFANMFRQHRQPHRTRNPDITLSIKISLLDVLKGKSVFVTYALRSGREERVNVEIPPGARSGDTVRYQGFGEEIVPGPRGNLNLQIQVLNERNWIRNGDNLLTSITVDALDLMLGCSTIVNTLEGKQLELKIPQGTKPNTKFSINDYGLPNINTGKKGSIVVEIEVKITPIHDKKVLKKLKSIRHEINGNL